MFAIVEIAGQQFKVEKDTKLFVHQLDGAAGASVEFDNVMLLNNEGDVKVGTPVLENVKVSAEIVEHLKGETVKVFKKKN